MIKRYEVMLRDKETNNFITIKCRKTSFVFYGDARRLATEINFLGHELNADKIAVVFDRRTHLQASYGLYSDNK